MDQRLSFITLAVPDVAAARRFYLDGLGWQAELDMDDILMIKVADAVILSLWSEAGFEAEVGPLQRGDGAPPITLSHNVISPEAVDDVLSVAAAAGASVTAGVHREWGGYSGYFVDPSGFRWEVAWNPGPTGDVVLPEQVSRSSP